MFTIRPLKVRGKFSRKLGDYGAERDLFAGYTVLSVDDTKIGRRVRIQGPKKEFFLYECRNPLTIISPPLVDGENARKQVVPLFFVSGMTSSGSIQGAQYFALINNELVAYKSSSGNCVEPL